MAMLQQGGPTQTGIQHKLLEILSRIWNLGEEFVAKACVSKKTQRRGARWVTIYNRYNSVTFMLLISWPKLQIRDKI